MQHPFIETFASCKMYLFAACYVFAFINVGCRKAEALSAGNDMPIIEMTANAFTEDLANCEKAGMNDFLTKPVNPELLFTTVARWLGLGAIPNPEAVASHLLNEMQANLIPIDLAKEN